MEGHAFRARPCWPPAAAFAAAAASSSSSSSSKTPAEQGPSGGTAAGEGPPPVRRIILLRHADSEASSSTRDHERPISLDGRREARSIARRLRELGWAPDLIIASNSRRTKMTLDVMAEADDRLAEVDAHYLGSLYTVAALDGQTRSHLEECIRGVACDTANFCVMCVGHNKGWEEAASSFAKQAVRLHTASAALFEAVGRTWSDATHPEVEWRLVQVVTP
ncbi:hypothetical protein MNEG_14713 [Monoraphidium neglectum]|uniref:Phosphoglycerate mutase n=1 Tax=Monoraphidium neglectum TaxID=145388 RepID=A0A0D2LN76_9CHLO|nr:hypothetical protein MNEG_14713 [Monoraphidium neglectum]KIY93249.1 hypothetical protein MNEG_14713 [Monoraphidium neglectum]|eukprot:XP_013892269.1 hypothetical protein MNEG_14713 [Monoraphidium neglectum]